METVDDSASDNEISLEHAQWGKIEERERTIRAKCGGAEIEYVSKTHIKKALQSLERGSPRFMDHLINICPWIAKLAEIWLKYRFDQ